MLVIGNGLGGGNFPFAALIAKSELHVAGERALGYYTHEKNPVACAAALAATNYLERHQALQNVVEMSQFVETRIKQIQESHPIVKQFRASAC
ncbi:MAG: Ornithine aminotransferase 2 [Verrucomicrobia subdivision 3 bacterium]|nr:Ornithine aminotransferase 2 [Limisphaerales bacterium]MCS1416612.1 Ornithine aminotransferase 2 [Limisphaerales bacterium]